jgi:hypothetical protein
MHHFHDERKFALFDCIRLANIRIASRQIDIDHLRFDPQYIEARC